MLQDRSVLADLTIHRWTATKHDRTVSAEVERSHAAKNAGRYNKQLIDKEHLAEIDELANQLRKLHYNYTLPWTDKGARLLPSKLFMDYREGVTKLKQQRKIAVDKFIGEYPNLVTQARQRLNTMFDPKDYPPIDVLRNSFDVELEITPVPDVGDFRVDIAKEVQDEVRQQLEANLKTRQEKAVKDCWQRVHEVAKRVYDVCSMPKPRIYDSMMDNVDDLAVVIQGLNITNDPQLDAITADLRTLWQPSAALRNSLANCKRAAAQAELILSKVPQ